MKPDEDLLDVTFEGVVIHWRGPSPFHFVAVPEAHVGEVRFAAQVASYGWGVVPVEAKANDIAFTTSLFPRDGGYLLPLKDKVRREAGIALGERVHVRMRITGRPRAR